MPVIAALKLSTHHTKTRRAGEQGAAPPKSEGGIEFFRSFMDVEMKKIGAFRHPPIRVNKCNGDVTSTRVMH